MQKVKIITDSGADIKQNFYPNIKVLPMTIRFGDSEYRDGIDISTNEFYEMLIETDQLPVTSLVSPAAFADAYEEALKEAEELVVITISSKLSGTYQSAILAAEEFGDRIFIIDSRNVATAEQILVLRAAELAETGLSAREIYEKLNDEKEHIHILAVLDTLEYLKKGGRISKSAALVGSALSIKPVVTVSDGNVAMIGKARGSKNGNNYLIKEIENTAGVDFSKPLALGYTGLSDQMLRKYIEDSKLLWEGHEDSLKISHIGPTIGTHVGPGAIAVAFFEK